MKPQSQSNGQDGFSLIEVIVSLFVLALLALALAKALTFAKYTAEDNLYEATALTVAVSAVEQIKGISLDALRDPPEVGGKPVFQMTVESGTTDSLFLDEPNTIEVPIVTRSDGATSKRLEMTVEPSIAPMATGSGFWIEVRYSYQHPRSGKTRDRVVRNARTVVPSA